MNDTSLMVALIFFYALLGFFLFSWGRYQYSIQFSTSGIETLKNPTALSLLSHAVSLFSYPFRMIFFGVKGIPSWLNAVFFTPLLYTMIWLFARWMRGV